jgi:signal transduction histidine kinase
LAQELHDQVGQKLTALGINLNIIRTEIPEDGPDKIYSCLTESQELVEQTTRLIRGVMSDLRPPMLDDLGLMETLHWYGEQFTSRTGIVVNVQGQDQSSHLPTPVENALFRITQEALTNVAKHAQATEVRVALRMGETAHLIIADNGIGFEPEHSVDIKEPRGWGLLIMAERAEGVGGRCWIESDASEGGTKVITEVPR